MERTLGSEHMLSLFRFAILIALLCASLRCVERNTTPQTPPNVLLILTDDMGYGDVQISGNPYIKTPHLDELAKRSFRFENFYVSPVCAPTRASLLTGRYHQRTGVRSVTNGYETMDPDEITIAEILQQNGYRTALFGKWHLGEYYPCLPNAQGFDEFIGFKTGHTDNYFNALLTQNHGTIQTNGYITDVLTNKALEFMIQNPEKPFFCYLSYNAPHSPLQVDSIWFRRYLDLGLEERTARVYGMVENIDHNIGQIMTSLDANQLLGSTIIIFMSDNGPISGWRIPQNKMRYNAGLRDQKFTVYEGGIRTQSYWMWEGNWQENVETEQVAAHIDVLPTIMDALGIETSSKGLIDGISLVSVLSGETKTLKERIFYQKYALETLRDPAPFPGGIARKGDWKMVNGTELYNLERDPGESENIADIFPEVLDELNSEYENWYGSIVTVRNLQSIPITIGHIEENPVYLQPHHGMAQGNIEFTGKRGLLGEGRGTHPTGVDGDWLANWKERGDQISWEVQVLETGIYQFGLQLRDIQPEEPVPFECRFSDSTLEKTILPEELKPDWANFTFGEAYIESGDLNIHLRLTNDLDQSRLEVRSVSLEKQ